MYSCYPAVHDCCQPCNAGEARASAQPQHMAEFSLRILRHVMQQRAPPGWSAAVWRALRSPCACSGALSGSPGLWREALKLLHMASLPSQQDFPPVSPAGVALEETVAFWAELASSSGVLPVRRFALDWLQAAAPAAADSCGRPPDQPPGFVEGTQNDDALLLTAFRGLELDRQLEQAEAAESTLAHQAAACLFSAVVHALLPLAADSSAEVRSVVGKSFQTLLPAVRSLPELAKQPMLSAQQDAPDAVPGTSGRHGMALSGDQLGLLGEVACERLSDVDSSVAATWSGVISQLAPHLARLATGIGTGAAAPGSLVTMHVRALLQVAPSSAWLIPHQRCLSCETPSCGGGTGGH